MPAPADYKNKFLKKPPKRLAVVDQHGCSGCANSPACVAFCETVTVKDQIVDAIDRRFGGLVDALTLRGDGAGEVPPDLVQDIRRVPHAFRGFARPE